MYINKPSVTKIEATDRVNLLYSTKVCSLSEWCFIVSTGVSSDHSQLRCTGFAGSH